MRVPDIEPELILTPDLCLFIPAFSTLVISDVHMGRVQHMRKHGLAIPQALIQRDLHRLTQSLDRWQPSTCLFLGDLFHSQVNSEWPQLFQALAPYHQTQFRLIVGNHDRHVHNQLPKHWSMHQEWKIEELQFRHEPTDTTQFEVCGHLHPKYVFKAKAKQTLGLPCFWLSPNRLVLPAFSSLAGGYPVKPQTEHRLFISDGQMVREIPNP